MRVFVVVLSILAVGKIGYQEWVYRAAVADALIAAYRERAWEACARSVGNQAAKSPGSVTWSSASETRASIGDERLDVAFWRFDSSRWDARFRDPHLHLVASVSNQRLKCRFNTANGVAMIDRSATDMAPRSF